MANIFDDLKSLIVNNQGNNSSSQKVSTAEKAPASSTDSQNNKKNFFENIGDSVRHGIESVVSVVSGKSFQSPSQPQKQPQTQSQIGPKVGDKRKAELFSPDNRSEPLKKSRSGQYGVKDGVERGIEAAQRAQKGDEEVSKMLKERSQSSFSQGAGGSQGYNNNHSLSPSPVQRVNQTPVASTGSTQGSEPQEKPQVNLRKSRSLPNTSNNSSQQSDDLPPMDECIRRAGAAADRGKWTSTKIKIEEDNRKGYVSIHGDHFTARDPDLWRGVSSFAGSSNPYDKLTKPITLQVNEERNSQAYIEAQKVARQTAIDTTRFNREWAGGQRNAQQTSQSSIFNVPVSRQNLRGSSSFHR